MVYLLSNLKVYCYQIIHQFWPLVLSVNASTKVAKSNQTSDSCAKFISNMHLPFLKIDDHQQVYAQS